MTNGAPDGLTVLETPNQALFRRLADYRRVSANCPLCVVSRSHLPLASKGHVKEAKKAKSKSFRWSIRWLIGSTSRWTGTSSRPTTSSSASCVSWQTAGNSATSGQLSPHFYKLSTSSSSEIRRSPQKDPGYVTPPPLSASVTPVRPFL